MLETIRREVGFYDMIYRIVLRIGIFVSSVNVSEIGHAKMSCRGGQHRKFIYITDCSGMI